MSTVDCFFLLIQAAVGTSRSVNLSFTEDQWEKCFRMAEEQGVLGVLFPVVKEGMVNVNGQRYEPLFSEWLGYTAQIHEQNKLVNDRAELLVRIINGWGCNCCVLKGQGIGQLYPDPLLRQSGDIDVWIDNKQDVFIQKSRDNFTGIENIDYVHSGMSFFIDVKVEIHFRPSWMYNPLSNKRLQDFFRLYKDEQFANFDTNVGFAYPTIQFNLVHSLVHINRHIFEEGIGLRQLMDYYYILTNSTQVERSKAFSVLKRLQLGKFTAAVMYVMEKVFNIDPAFLLCSPNHKEGIFLLDEIIQGGNFGKYDKRNKWFEKGQRVKKNIFVIKRSLRYLKHYPSEVIWIPFWKIWHYCWRKYKGYL